MYTQFFFDDQKLFGREGLTREYGVPEPIADAVFFDGKFSTDLRAAFAFRTGDGLTRMIYTGRTAEDDAQIPMLAVSEDGVHFRPESTVGAVTLAERAADNQILEPMRGGKEIAAVVRFDGGSAEERYVMLISGEIGSDLKLDGPILASGDLVRWHPMQDAEAWNGGCEPITAAFYNADRACYTILRRPTWGDRRVGHVDTTDFRTFTPYEPCMQCDSSDAPLDEIYGVSTVTDLGSLYVGTPLVYGGLFSSHMAKGNGGGITAQLAYSFDGHHWQRSLRKPFLQHGDGKRTLCWLSSVLPNGDGSLTLLASTSDYEHGKAFRTPGSGRIRAYRLRRDGFICLKTEKGESGILTTREFAYRGGDITLNLQAAHATVALYETCSRGVDVDVMGCGEPIPGFSHEDCLPFSGDDTAWVPAFRGASLESLRDRSILIEVRLTDGAIWSIGGEIVPMMNTEGALYRRFGVLPAGKYGKRF